MVIAEAIPTSGAQTSLVSGAYRAEIATVGASLRSLTYNNRNLVVPFDADELRPNFRGAILAPWPNRITDGIYVFAGEREQLAISEPVRGHALHGLVCWINFEVTEKGESSVSLRTTIEPQPGYPHRVVLTVTYTLAATGLTVQVEALNTGATAAPFGTSWHPYLVGGTGRVDDWHLEFDAKSVYTTVGPRLLLGEIETIEVDARFDFSNNLPIGDRKIDHAFTGFSRTAGIATARLTDATGAGVQMSWDDKCNWVQLHTADLKESAADRIGMAVEPMTCPPDAFNSQLDLLVLQPNEVSLTSWRLVAIL